MAHDGATDPRVRDDTLLHEIELVADLVVAVSRSSQRHLSQKEIDEALGLDAVPDHPNRPEI